MAKKKTAKKEAPVTADVEVPVEEYDATRYTPWVPGNMPVGGKSNSTEQLNDHPTEHNHSAEAISDIVDRFADLRLYVPGVNSCGIAGDLKVDGNSDLKINVPADYWANDSGTVFSSLGMFGGTQGSYATSMTSNGYRNTSGKWTSLSVGGNAGAVQISLLPTGVFEVRTKGNYPTGSASNPPARLTIDDVKTEVINDLKVDGQTLAQNGTKAAPAYSFTSDPNTGMYRPQPDVIEIVSNGKRLMQLGNTANDFNGAWIPGISARSIVAAANVHVDTRASEEGALYRSTASRVFMQEVEAVNFDATNSVYDLNPIWFRSTCDGDNIKHSHYGLAAEDVAAVDPRLAIMATDEDGVETADNVNTNAVIALLVSAVKSQREQISDLTARVEMLEGQKGL